MTETWHDTCSALSWLSCVTFRSDPVRSVRAHNARVRVTDWGLRMGDQDDIKMVTMRRPGHTRVSLHHLGSDAQWGWSGLVQNRPWAEGYKNTGYLGKTM